MDEIRKLIHCIEEVLPLLPLPPKIGSALAKPTQHSTCDGLDSVSDKELEQHLEPIREALVDIDAVTLLNLKQLSKAQGGASLGPNRRKYIQPIHNEITPPIRGIRYIHIQEVDNCYSIGIFVFPPRSVIPLHDHPAMAVLSRILYGEINVQSFDIEINPTLKRTEVTSNECINNQDIDDCVDMSEEEDERNHSTASNPNGKTKGWLSSFLSLGPSLLGRREDNAVKDQFYDTTPTGSIHAIQKNTCTIRSPEISLLYPRRGNLHKFAAGEQGAAILDVLLPPYDANDGRDCTFYRVGKIENICNDSKQCLLIPTEQPNDYQCVSGEYKDLCC